MTYLDHNATTPVAQPVLEAMLPAFSSCFGNPASVHGAGRAAAALVDDSRANIAGKLGTGPNRVTFTSGSTEALNLAVRGLPAGNRKRIMVGATEHKAVIEAAKSRHDAEVSFLPVHHDGTIDLVELENQLREDVLLVAVMAVNNETGVINPISRVAQLTSQVGALLLCDATQALGKIPMSDIVDADMLAISAHKIYGPKGAGALISSRESQALLEPQIWGGGQERGLRSGTSNVTGIVGLSAAFDLVESERADEVPRQSLLRDQLERLLSDRVPDMVVNGYGAPRVSNTLNLRFRGVDGEALLANLRTVDASTGSACQGSVPEPSHVLLAMGLTRSEAEESIRLSLGRDTSDQDVHQAADEIVSAVERIREFDAA